MRNLNAYPITRDEVIAVLEKIPQDCPPGVMAGAVIGGTNDFIRSRLIDFFDRGYVMTDFLDE